MRGQQFNIHQSNETFNANFDAIAVKVSRLWQDGGRVCRCMARDSVPKVRFHLFTELRVYQIVISAKCCSLPPDEGVR